MRSRRGVGQPRYTERQGSGCARTQQHTAIITSNFWPECTGIGQVTTEFAEFLSSCGAEVRVATAMPYYPEWSIGPRYKGLVYHTEFLRQILIHRAWHYSRPSPSVIGRLAHELSLCLLSIRNIVRVLGGAEVAYVVSPDLAHAFLALLLARVNRTRCVLIVQDVMPDAAVELGMLSNSHAVRVCGWMARCSYALASEIYTLGEGMRRRILRDHPYPERVKLLPNTIDSLELAPKVGQGLPFRERFVPPGTFAVVHSGNMGKKQDLTVLLRTADQLRQHSDIQFYVFGDGAAKAEFLEMRAALQLTNVSHFPLQDRELLPHVLHGADVLLVNQVAEATDIVVPSKLITAMGAGAMIVAACSEKSETARIISASRGGLLVPAGDAGALARTVLAIKNGRINTHALRDNARAFAAANYERSAVYGRLIESARSTVREPFGVPA